MVTAIPAFNPMLTTSGAGLFRLSSDGFIQGVAMDDPASRNYLSGGVLASAETLPMWGGVGIFEDVTSGTGSGQDVLGGSIGRALTLANMTGFSVFNQAHAWIQSPQSEVPMGLSGMTVNFYRFGSNARIPVAVDPALISLSGGLITQQVSWDFNLQRLIPYSPVQGAVSISAMSWANTNGGTVTVTTSAANTFVTGDDVTIAGAVPAAYNGDWPITVTDTTHFTFPLPAATTPGTVTTLGGIPASGGALNCRILDVNIGNSKTVNYNQSANTATWNNNGSTALILI